MADPLHRAAAILAAAFFTVGLTSGCSPGSPRRFHGPCALRAPGERWVAYAARAPAAPTFDLHAVRADGSCAIPVTEGGADALFPAWSPLGVLAYARASGGSTQLVAFDPATDREQPLEFGLARATSPAFSPDGRRIAFEGREAGAGSSDVFVAPAGGGTPLRLTDGVGDAFGPTWSEDGATLYFGSNRSGAYEIWRVPAAGGALEQITSGARLLGSPAVGPAGRLAWTAPSVLGSTSRIRILDPGAGAATTLSDRSDSEPAFEPGGGRLAVTSYRSGAPEIFLLDAATGEVVRQLTGDGRVHSAPAFAPAYR